MSTSANFRNDWKIFWQGVRAWGVSAAVVEQFHYFRARVHERIDQFDRRYGTETSRMVGIGDLDGVGENGGDAVHYWPTRPIEFDRMMAAVGDIDHRRHVFIDVGCGKGRVALLAAGLPFKRVIGFDFSPALVEHARRNVERYTGPVQADIELVVADAAEFEFPAEDLVVYMFDPFGPTVLRKFLANLALAARSRAQRVVVIYYSPDYEDLFGQAGFGLVATGRGRSFPWRLYALGGARRGRGGTQS